MISERVSQNGVKRKEVQALPMHCNQLALHQIVIALEYNIKSLCHFYDIQPNATVNHRTDSTQNNLTLLIQSCAQTDSVGCHAGLQSREDSCCSGKLSLKQLVPARLGLQLVPGLELLNHANILDSADLWTQASGLCGVNWTLPLQFTPHKEV